MLSSLAKEHQQQQQIQKQQLDKKRITAIEATNRFSQFVLDKLNKEVSEAFVNQKKIDAKVKQLNLNTAQFVKQSQQWIQLLESFNTSLKELGDVENWSKKIETDMKIINTTLNSVLKAIITTCSVIIFFAFLTARIDNSTNWNWFLVFIPLFILQTFYLIDCIFLMIKQRFKFNSRLIKLSAFFICIILICSFEILICVRLDYYPELNLSYLFIPAWLVMLSAIGFLLFKLAIN